MESPGTKKVLVTILEQGWIRPELLKRVNGMQNDPRYAVAVQMRHVSPSEDARNGAVLDMLAGGFDYLLTIDDDTIPLRNPLDLVELGLDVVGFSVPQWNIKDPNFPIYFVGMDKVDGGYAEHKNREGLQEVDAVGSACLLMSRKVLETVKAPFVRRWNEDGLSTLGLDFLFCEKAKEAGFKVYCHYDFIADHFKEISLLKVLDFKLS